MRGQKEQLGTLVFRGFQTSVKPIVVITFSLFLCSRRGWEKEEQSAYYNYLKKREMEPSKLSQREKQPLCLFCESFSVSALPFSGGGKKKHMYSDTKREL